MRVYFFPLDDKLNETLPVIPVELRPDGSADITKLPAELQDRLNTFGISDPTRIATLYPKDGEAFLEALVESSNLYFRFRHEPETRSAL